MRRVLLAVFGTVAGLVGLLSFKTHPESVAAPPAAVSATAPGSSATIAAGTSTGTSGGSTGSSTTSRRTKASTASTPTKAKSSSAAKATTETITGSSVDTRYGPVQVRIVVAKGKLTGVTAVDYPTNSGRDQQINAAAIPALNQEVLAAGNAKVDMISGATYTSQGYLDSLQSALDKAGL